MEGTRSTRKETACECPSTSQKDEPCDADLDGPNGHTNWHPGEPNAYTTNHNCVHHIVGGWSDANCEDTT